MDKYVINEITRLIHHSINSAKKVHDYTFGTESKEANLENAALFANAILSHVSAARAIYASYIEQLQHYSLDTLFHQFEQFVYEFLNDYATNHSLQWVNQEYETLIEMFEKCEFPKSVVEE